MSRNSERMEAYEDARFAVLMDAVVQAEGQWALEENQRLKEDPESAVPDSLRKRCETSIRKAFSKKKRNALAGTLRRRLTIAATAVLVAAAAVAILFAAVPNLRADVINTFRVIQDTLTGDSPSSSLSGPASPELALTVGWLPEGFEQPEEIYLLDRTGLYVEKDDPPAQISILKMLPSESSISIDTENATITQVKMHGYDAMLIEKDDEFLEARIIWLDTDQNIIYYVNTIELGTETMLKIAENVS